MSKENQNSPDVKEFLAENAHLKKDNEHLTKALCKETLGVHCTGEIIEILKKKSQEYQLSPQKKFFKK